MQGPSLPKGLILDLDGTLIDTEGLALEAWTTAAEALKLPIRESFFHSLIGLNSPDMTKQLLTELPDAKLVARLRAESWIVYEDLLLGGIPVKAGATELLEEALRNEIPCAVATSSSLNSAREKLTAANLRDFFQVLSTGDQVSQGKPHPEIFLKAADKLSLPPTECWAAEDSLVGVESAARAGTTTWMVVDRVQPTERARSLAWRVVGSLLHVRDEFRALVEREQN